MATYPHEKVLADYARDKMTVEMAMGHSLQHIGHLYTAQRAAAAEHQTLRKQVAGLEQTVGALQSEVTGLKQVVTTLHARRPAARLSAPRQKRRTAKVMLND